MHANTCECVKDIRIHKDIFLKDNLGSLESNQILKSCLERSLGSSPIFFKVFGSRISRVAPCFGAKIPGDKTNILEFMGQGSLGTSPMF